MTDRIPSMFSDDAARLYWRLTNHGAGVCELRDALERARKDGIEEGRKLEREHLEQEESGP